MTKRESETERIRRITNTPTIVPADTIEPPPPPKKRVSGIMTSSAQLAQYRYQPAQELWRRTIERLLASASVSVAQAQSWLQPCQLATMQLPSGEVMSAHVRAHTSFAADHLRHHYAPMLRLMLQSLTGQQVILFIRGPQDSPYKGPPDGYDIG
ncbi:MAG TPA: hypothetical protein VFU63_04515 [Ktedonobacterales bacterium]|nr:hypothetical protein [Ktedonobacterales bacterium]